jgi:predicted Zn-dependent protease
VIAGSFGGWYLLRERGRAVDREEALRAAREQQPDAADRLRAHLARKPADAEAVEALVECLLRAGTPFAEVEPHLNRLCELRPDDSVALRIRAGLRIRNGRLAEGLADGLRALELDPADHTTRKLVAMTAFEAGEHDVAARELGRLIESSPFPRNELAAALVKVHLQAGDVARAEEALDRHFPAAQAGAEGRALRGVVHQAAGRNAEAVAVLRAVADQSPEQRELALYHLAKAQSALGREDDARRTLDELEVVKARDRMVVDAGQRPDDMPTQVRAAEVLLADGKPKEAAALLEQAMRRLGRDPAAAVLLARAYRQLGRLDLADQWDPPKR